MPGRPSREGERERRARLKNLGSRGALYDTRDLKDAKALLEELAA